MYFMFMFVCLSRVPGYIIFKFKNKTYESNDMNIHEYCIGTLIDKVSL